ncbi:MAG: ASKHA domain-containing protein [Desulfobacteraceae bacterium]
MPTLMVNMEERQRRIPFEAGRSLRDILDATDLRVRSGCGGRGACGLCRVRIDAGQGGVPTANERVYLDTDELDRGIRLACQVIPTQDLQIAILAPAPKALWRSLPDDAGQRMGRICAPPWKNLPLEVSTPCGVAVDLGTTHISLSLYELSSGKWLAGRHGLNPQMRYGSDVMARLVTASGSAEQARAMSRQVVEAIGEALFDIAAREGINIERIVRLIVVGNTAMLALLSGQNYELLLQPSHWMRPVDCLPDRPDLWAVPLGIHPRARIEVIAPLAGFVGSDLLAGLMRTHLTENGPGGLFIDFGTNSEMALWDGRVLRVTSAAGGPAFEGSGISCGAPADPGAIYRVNFRRVNFRRVNSRRDNSRRVSPRNEVLDFAVISDSQPRGLCGSGLVDLIAGLVRSGSLTNKGQFGPDVPQEGFVVARGEHTIVLTKSDVDMFQRAKAAIGTGVQVLLTQAEMEYKDLRRIYVGGLFGRFLDVVNAQQIGLLPVIPPERVDLCGNTALAGCSEALLSSIAVQRLKELRDRTRIINLSRWPDFDDLFLTNLYLQPMRGA